MAGERVELQREHAALGVEREAGPGQEVPRVGVARVALLAGGGEAHRAPGEARRIEHDRNLGVVVGLGAEAAADVRANDPDPMLGQFEDVGGEPAPEGLGELGGRVQGVAPVRGVVGAEVGARLHRASRDAGGADVELGHVGGAGEGRAHRRGVAEGNDVGRVGGEVRMQDGALRGERLPHVGERRQLPVLDLHRLRRVLRLCGGLGDHRRDLVADVAHHVAGEDRPLRAIHRPSVVEGHRQHGRDEAPEPRRIPLRRGEHAPHPRHRAGIAGRDALDARVRVGTAHERGVGGAGREEVVDVAPPAGQKAVVLISGKGLAYVHA